MNTKRKICVITGTRAEYGLLYWLLKELQSDPEIELQLAVTGMHFAPAYGLTYKQIQADGFRIDARIEMLLNSDSPGGITKSMGLGLIGFGDELARLKPDFLVILGDRFEMLSAAQAAMIHRIPIAHIHGGETTEGAIDEAIRHAITKMAHLHFVAAEAYRQRVIQMGENPANVFNYGAPGLDQIARINYLSRSELEQELDYKFGAINFLVTYHPVTLSDKSPMEPVTELLRALDQFPEAHILFTGHNCDASANEIGNAISAYVAKNGQRAKLFTSLGTRRYLSAIRHANVVIGNSSSGLTEAPALKRPTVNIGDRQRGRLKAASVIDCDETCNAAADAIRLALSPEFQKIVEQSQSVYGIGDASRRIKEALKSVDLKNILYKHFFDVDWTPR